MTKDGEMCIEMEADEHLVARGMNGCQIAVGSGRCSNPVPVKKRLYVIDTRFRVGRAV